MTNQLVLQAIVSKVFPLRYTPSGLPVLELVLKHSSEQFEAENQRQISMEVEAVIIGKNALDWQSIEDSYIEVAGFLAQKNQKNTRLVLHIQSIHLIK